MRARRETWPQLCQIRVRGRLEQTVCSAFPDLRTRADGADRAVERALDLAEPDGWLLPFLLHPAKGLLERRTRCRTSHAALATEILGLLAGPGGMGDGIPP